MMDGRNSSGRKVSLLNDSCAQPVAAASIRACQQLPPVRLPSLTTTASAAHSPSSSATSLHSPQTPPLIRSESSDSRAFGLPSPLTPHSASFDHASHFPHKQSVSHQLAHQHEHGPHAQHGYYLPRQPSWSSQKMDDPTLYPPFPENNTTITGFPLPTPSQPMHQARVRTSTSPVSESHVSNASVASAAPSAPKLAAKKNQYPCPLAKQYQCNDHFTTSGHAARHAKKHTGRKDAICPECNKAFTRKDNMEQHRRTHQNVRGPSKNTENRVKKPSKQSRKSEKADKAAIDAQFEAAVNAQLEEQPQQIPLADPAQFVLPTDPSLQQTLMPASGGPYFMNAEPIAALPQPMTADFGGRPPIYRSGYTNTLDFTNIAIPTTLADGDLPFTYPSPGLSNGLNTLALAASGHRRLSEPSEQARPLHSERTDSESSSTKSAAATP